MRPLVVRVLVVRALVIRVLVVNPLVVRSLVVRPLVVRVLVVRVLVVRPLVVRVLVVRPLVVRVLVVRPLVVRVLVVRPLIVRVLVVRPLGPVVRRPISANPGLNFNPGFFFFCSKVFSRVISSLLFRASNHQIVGRKNKTEFASQGFISEIKFRTNPG